MSMKSRVLGVLTVCSFVAALVAPAAAYAAYPDRPVKIVVPVAAGGALDAIGRLVADYLRVRMNGTFIVENRPGANAEIGSAYVATAPADGYTLLINTDSIVSASLVSSSGKIDPVKSFKPVSMVVSSPGVLVVHPQLGVKSVQDFIALAKTRPLNVASTGSGTASQFTGMMFRQNAAINWTDIPYNGSGPAMVALLGGQVDALWAMSAPLLPHLKSGKVIALGVTSAAPSPQLPGVPAIASVMPHFVANNWTGVFAPAATPDAIVTQLSKAIGDMMKDPKQVARLAELGFLPIGSDPATLETEVKSSLQRWKSVLAKQSPR